MSETRIIVPDVFDNLVIIILKYFCIVNRLGFSCLIFACNEDRDSNSIVNWEVIRTLRGTILLTKRDRREFDKR
jgi:hypothetical protein